VSESEARRIIAVGTFDLALTSTLFFFGAMSPYSWFAAERIRDLIPEACWRPVYAGGLFRAHGRSSWGLGDRRADGLAECERRAAEHGLGAIRWPQPWPTNDILVARAMAFSERESSLIEFALAAMRIAFREGGDLGELTVVQKAAMRAGLDPKALARAVQEPSVKDAVRAAHDQAVSFGVFGVPTVVVGGELFWGDDRLSEAAAASRRSGG